MKRTRRFTVAQQMDCPHWRITRAYHRRWACRRCGQVFIEDFRVYDATRDGLKRERSAHHVVQSTQEKYRAAEQALEDVKGAFGVKKIQHLLEIGAAIQQGEAAR